MKHILLITTSLLFFTGTVDAALRTEDKISCEDMGYRLTADECKNLNGIAIFCPFATAEQRMVVCLNTPCMGYPLVESDFSKTVSDEQPVTQHIKGSFIPKINDSEGVKGCLFGWDKNADGEIEETWFYRIKQCKDQSIYQNGICDVGCDKENVYPYNQHPGNLAGRVISCVDKDGEWYGYEECNDGWKESKGRCELGECNVEEYSYFKDPNLSEVRGETATCKIGGNNYYKYKADTCLEGFTYFNGLCQRQCPVTDCTEEITIEGYKDYTCRIDSRCQAGDTVLSSNGKSIGVIVHMPDATNPRVVVTSTKNYSKPWVEQGYNGTTGFPILSDLNNAYADYNGLYNTYRVKQFDDTVAYAFPLAEIVYAHSSANCADDFCQQGQWYIPALGEVKSWYENRYVIKNALNRETFIHVRTSTAGQSNGIWSYQFSTGHIYPQVCTSSIATKPFLSFKVKE